MKRTKFIFLLSITCLLLSCGRSSIDRQLDDIESYIRERPDSALSAIRSIDRTLLSSAESRAHFSLLHAMALDKNYIDTTDLSVIQPAIDYYREHGSPQKRMRTYFYLGCIYYNRGETDSAMTSYMKALEDSLSVNDNNLKEIIYSSISDIFSQNYNDEEELNYALRALEYGRVANDSLGIWAITGHIASCLANLKMWDESERYYQAFYGMPVYDSVRYFRRKINHVKNYILGPTKDADKCIEILEEVIKSYPRAMTVEGYCLYAYAFQQKGNESQANSLLRQLEAMDSHSEVLRLWRYRILRDQKKYDKAISDLESSVLTQDSIVISALRQSLVQTQRDYIKLQAIGLKKDNETKRLNILFTISLSVLIISLLGILYFRRIAAYNSRIRKLYDLQREAQVMLSLLNEQNEELSSELKQKELDLLSLKKQFASMYKSQFKSLNDLCAAYLSPVKKDKKDKLYEEALRQINIIANDEGSRNKFMTIVDKSLDNIIQKLREDLHGSKEEDFTFLMFVIVGFDAKTIASLTGYSVGTVYTKKTRLKHKISKLNSPNRAFYLDFLE